MESRPSKTSELHMSSPDQVNISIGAKGVQRLQELVEVARSRAEHASEVRPDVVIEARRRLEEGYYERADTLRAAAARILPRVRQR